MGEGPGERSSRYRFGLVAGRALLGAGRAAARLLPARVRKALDDRFFGAVFQATRVTNDDYGWTAPPPGTGEAISSSKSSS